jgi:L-ascorbate metabolism protein UlaG (beta-lactamase superfamily)
MALFRSFGKTPTAEKSAAIRQSPQYKNDHFENSSPTPMMTGNSSMLRMAWKFFNKPKATAPSTRLPSIKTDLKNLPADKTAIVWFGHSSYFISAGGKNILVDPVMSGHASPFSFGAKSFAGSDIYSPDELPDIDVLVITHDHYDHLDHRTIQKLKPKLKAVVTSLGISSHLISWGIDKHIIKELDWWEGNTLPGGLEFIATPARHFSGRTTRRNTTLWSSFVLRTGVYNIYIGADSGYDSHFKQIGEKYGPFDLAVLETGQYNESWSFIHMLPEEAVQATIDLNAKVLMPVHWAKFALAFHPWNEPVQRVVKRAAELNVKVTTPKIGEPVVLDHSYPSEKWW